MYWAHYDVVDHCLDDETSLNNSRNDVILRTNMIFNTMKRMGINMHVGSGKKAFKTEAIFSPSRSKISEWLRKGKIESIFSSEDQSEIIDPSSKEKKVPYHVTKKVLDKAYNNTCETNDIIVNDDFFVSFTKIVPRFIDLLRSV